LGEQGERGWGGASLAPSGLAGSQAATPPGEPFVIARLSNEKEAPKGRGFQCEDEVHGEASGAPQDQKRQYAPDPWLAV